MQETITHEVVAELALSSSRAKTRDEVEVATAQYLATGGEITRLPDTVEEQRAWLRLILQLDDMTAIDDKP